MPAAAGPPRLTLGANNIYLLVDGSDCLLIDAGPDYPGAWEAIVAQLAVHDLRPADVRQVVLTHHHRDHAGLAARWQQQGAVVACGRDDAPALTQTTEQRGVLRSKAADLLVRYGVPPDLATHSIPTRDSGGDHGPWPAPLRMTPLRPDSLLDDGDRMTVGARHLTVIACPGHTPGSLLLYDQRGEAVFTGDHLLPQQVATTGIQFDGAARWPSLPPFLRSLERSRALAGATAMPGHGEPMADAGEAATWSLRSVERRTSRVLRRLVGGEATAYQLVMALYPHQHPAHLLPLMTEMIGLLDLLDERHQVTCRDVDGRLQFSAVLDGLDAGPQ